MISRPEWIPRFGNHENGRETLTGETMSVDHDAADEAIDKFLLEQQKIRDRWSHVRFVVFATGLGLLVWATFSVAAAVREHAGVVGLHKEVK